MVILIVFGLIFFLFGSKAGCLPAGELGVGLVVSRLLCSISPEESYSWISGIWHGLCFIPNFLWSCNFNVLYKAEAYTSGYNFWWWTMTIFSIVFTIFLYYPSLKVIFGSRY